MKSLPKFQVEFPALGATYEVGASDKATACDKVARLLGYFDYDEMIARMGEKWGESPLIAKPLGENDA